MKKMSNAILTLSFKQYDEYYPNALQLCQTYNSHWILFKYVSIEIDSFHTSYFSVHTSYAAIVLVSQKNKNPKIVSKTHLKG